MKYPISIQLTDGSNLIYQYQSEKSRESGFKSLQQNVCLPFIIFNDEWINTKMIIKYKKGEFK